MCNDLPIRELHALDHQPDELHSKVSTCLCRQAYGKGSPDLAGVGAVIGFGFQLSLATIYWISLFAEKIAIPTVWRKDRTQSRFTEWLEKHQQNCLWSQLLYTVTICFAGLLLQAQRGHNFIGVYESYSIQSSVIFTVISLELTVVTNFNKIQRSRLFYSTFFCVLMWGVIATIYPMWGAKREHILKACERYADENDIYWKDAVIKPFKDPDAPGANVQIYIQYFIIIASLFFLIGLWFFWPPTQCWQWLKGVKDRPILGKLMDWFCILAFAAMSMLLLQQAYRSFSQFLKIRKGMDRIWDGEIEQNIWGIGQVGALMSWAPLVVPMIPSAAACRNWAQRYLEGIPGGPLLPN